jgi:hypothetical protein
VGCPGVVPGGRGRGGLSRARRRAAAPSRDAAAPPRRCATSVPPPRHCAAATARPRRGRAVLRCRRAPPRQQDQAHKPRLQRRPAYNASPPPPPAAQHSPRHPSLLYFYNPKRGEVPADARGPFLTCTRMHAHAIGKFRECTRMHAAPFLPCKRMHTPHCQDARGCTQPHFYHARGRTL